jgi:hypothetical protein
MPGGVAGDAEAQPPRPYADLIMFGTRRLEALWKQEGE